MSIWKLTDHAEWGYEYECQVCGQHVVTMIKGEYLPDKCPHCGAGTEGHTVMNTAKRILKERRTTAGIAQAQLAEKAGMNIRQIQKIEKGEIQLENITLKNAIGLANALGITPEQLLGAPGRLNDDERQAVERAITAAIWELETQEEEWEKRLNGRPCSELTEMKIRLLKHEIEALWAAREKI